MSPADGPDIPLENYPGRWWVAHVKPRQEKALAADIRAAGGACYLPIYETTRRSGKRKWKASLPLFPGYVFLCCQDETERLAALKTQRIVRLIDVPDPGRLVCELSSIRRLLGLGLAVDPHKTLQRGVRCRIRSGPLQGMEGEIERRRGTHRFVVEVGILGQGASVEIDADLLESID